MDILERYSKGVPYVGGLGERLASLPDDASRQRAIGLAERLGAVSPRRDGMVTEFAQGFMQGGVGVLEGLGSTAEELTGSSGLRQYAQDILERNRQWQPDPDYSALSLSPANIARAVGSGTAQSLGSVAAGAAATAATGGNLLAGAAASAAVTFGTLYGDTVKEYREAMPEQDDTTVKALAFLSAGIQSALEGSLGPEQMVSSVFARRAATQALGELARRGVLREVIRGFAKGGLTEGSEEVSQSIANSLVKSMGTGRLEFESARDIAEQAMAGFWGGAFMGGATNAYEAIGAQQPQSQPQSQPTTPAAVPAGQIAPGAVSAGQTTAAATPAQDTSPTTEATTEDSPQPSVTEGQRRLADAMGQAFGVTVHFLTPEEQRQATESAGGEVGGYYDPKTRTAYIDPADPRGVNFVMGHEAFHHMKATQPEVAQRLHDAIGQYLTEDARSDMSEAVSNDYKGQRLSTEDFGEELDANVFGMVMNDPEFALELAADMEARQQGMGKRFLAAVRKALERIMDFLSGVAETPQIRSMLNGYQEAYRQLAAITNDALEANRSEWAAHAASVIGQIANAPQVRQRNEQAAQADREKAWNRTRGRRLARELAMRRDAHDDMVDRRIQERRRQEEKRKDKARGHELARVMARRRDEQQARIAQEGQERRRLQEELAKQESERQKRRESEKSSASPSMASEPKSEPSAVQDTPSVEAQPSASPSMAQPDRPMPSGLAALDQMIRSINTKPGDASPAPGLLVQTQRGLEPMESGSSEQAQEKPDAPEADNQAGKAGKEEKAEKAPQPKASTTVRKREPKVRRRYAPNGDFYPWWETYGKDFDLGVIRTVKEVPKSVTLDERVFHDELSRARVGRDGDTAYIKIDVPRVFTGVYEIPNYRDQSISDIQTRLARHAASVDDAGLTYPMGKAFDDALDSLGMKVYPSPFRPLGQALSQSAEEKARTEELAQSDSGTKVEASESPARRQPRKRKSEPAVKDEPKKEKSNEEEVQLRAGGSAAGGESGVEQRDLQPVGEEAGDSDVRPEQGGLDRGGGDTAVDDEAGGGGVSPSPGGDQGQPALAAPSPQPEASAPDAAPKPPSRTPDRKPKARMNLNNYSSTGADVPVRSPSERIKANIAAIAASRKAAEEGRPATAEEKETIAGFTGWGGLGGMMRDYMVEASLTTLLGQQGYLDARRSAETAYYTPAPVVDALWRIAGNLGFRGGSILEGSAGIGNILARMPKAISESSQIEAVEIEPMTAQMLEQLYPDATVRTSGFEAVTIANNSVDLAITNVPFVTNLRVHDSSGDVDLSRTFSSIHDFCIAKNVRKLREGGIGIFITTKGTLDNSMQLLGWLSRKGNADVIGAFRLNSSTFVGTEVTTDILVIRKRVDGMKSPDAIEVSSVSPEREAEYEGKRLRLVYNSYFVSHPDHMAGVMKFGFEYGNEFRATSTSLRPSQDIDAEQRLKDFVAGFRKASRGEETAPKASPVAVREAATEGMREGSLTFDKKGDVALVQYGRLTPMPGSKVRGHARAEVLKDYNAIKEAVSRLVAYQLEHDGDEGLDKLQRELRSSFEAFTEKYGHLYRNNQLAWLKEDVDYAMVDALEEHRLTMDRDGRTTVLHRLADIFSQRVMRKERKAEVKTVRDGVLASIEELGEISPERIAEHLGMAEDEVRDRIVEDGLGFSDPETGKMEPSYRYLSGNVRKKLKLAEESNSEGQYDRNISELQKVVPRDIPWDLIEFTLGSSWIPAEHYLAYINEKTGTSPKLVRAAGRWVLHLNEYEKSNPKNTSSGVHSEAFGTWTLGTDLIDAAMNNRGVSVTETVKNPDGSRETHFDPDATAACTERIESMKEEFRDWMRDRARQQNLVDDLTERYNDAFNNFVPMSIPEAYTPKRFPGQVTQMNGKEFALLPHQAKAVIKSTIAPVLLAHEVGTGKTFTLISCAMEMRRLGVASKPMIVVQNATLSQFAQSARALYPNAKVLSLSERDTGKEKRQDFYAKIRYNDWDMVIIPQSVLDRIDDSEERKESYIAMKREEAQQVVRMLRENGMNREASQLEKATENEAEKLRERSDSIRSRNVEARTRDLLDRRQDLQNFDDLGIDAILVDEAHEYKHLGFSSSIQRVRGVDMSSSAKSQGLYLKVQSVLQRNGGKGVVFATGTPVSNTAAESWTFMKYLMPADDMKANDIYYFDDFVRNFGTIQRVLEFATDGRFKENTRFTGYNNMPELMRILSGVFDIVLTQDAGDVLKNLPKVENGKEQSLYLPQTPGLRSVMRRVRQMLQEFDGMSGSQKRENSHIPIVAYGLAKAAAIDPRLVADVPDYESTKTNEAVRQTLRALKESESYKGTVAIFSDIFRNRNTGFNLYQDIRGKLIEHGVPADQVFVMETGMTQKKKLEVFDKVNAGDIRVILGSTATLGTGVNIQQRLFLEINMDAPNRPMDYIQRRGRILRQGNLHKDMGIPVRILNFGVEDSLDVTAYQRLMTKNKFVSSVMNGMALLGDSFDNRSVEEEDDTFGRTMADLSGSQYSLLVNDTERKLRRLESKKKSWKASQVFLNDQIRKDIPSRINALEKLIQAAEGEKVANASVFPEGKVTSIALDGVEYTGEDGLVKFEMAVRENSQSLADKVRLGSNEFRQEHHRLTVNGRLHMAMSEAYIKSPTGKLDHRLQVGDEGKAQEHVPGLSGRGILDLLDKRARNEEVDRRIARYREQIAEHRRHIEELKPQLGKPFTEDGKIEELNGLLDSYRQEMQRELDEKQKKYAEMDAQAEDIELTAIDDDDGIKYSLRDATPSKEGYTVIAVNEYAGEEFNASKGVIIPEYAIFSPTDVPTEGDTLRWARQRCLDYARKNGIIGEHPAECLGEGALVMVGVSGLKSAINHGKSDEKLNLIAAIPAMLHNAVLVQTERLGQNTSHLLAAKVRYGKDRRLLVGMVIHENNRRYFYNHETCEIKEAETLQRTLEKQPVAMQRSTASTINVIHDRLMSSGLDKKDERNTKFSLRSQTNPIVQDGKVRDEYQDLLDTGQYTPETIAQWEDRALAWLDRIGDTGKAIDMIEDGMEPAGKVGTMVRRLVMESPEFAELPEERRRAIELRNALKGTEWGREGVARRLASLTLDSVAKVRSVLDAMRRSLTDRERQEQRRKVLEETGVDIDRLPADIADDPRRLDRVLTAALTGQATRADKLYEYWINAILSGPATHAANTIGNLANLAYELGLKRLGEVAVGKLLGRKDRARLDDFRAMWRAVDVRGAWDRARTAFDLEAVSGAGKFNEQAAPAIGGRLGRAIRIPGRYLRAADEFAKSLVVPVEAAAYALRTGRGRGLSGAELERHVQRELASDGSASSQYARRRSLELTFQEEPGAAIRYLVALREQGGAIGTVMKYMLPFLKTPGNLLRQGVRKSPLGVVPLATEAYRAWRSGKGVSDELVSRAAEQLLAWGAVAGLILAGDDDDLPVITGTNGGGSRGERDFRGRNVPAYSIRVGDKWYSYRRIEPIATGLALIADGIEAYRSVRSGGDATAALKTALGGAVKMVGDKSYLASIGQIVDLVNNPEREGARWMTDFAASWMPNAVRQASAALDGERPDTNVRTSGAQWWRDQWQVVLSKAGLARLAPRVDCFGRPVTKDEAEESGPGDVAWRLMVPVATRDAGSMDGAELAIWNWNAAHPEKAYWPSVPNFRFRHGGKDYIMTGRDYADFAREAGRLAHRQILNAINHRLIRPSSPGEKDMDLIRQIFERSRRQTRDRFVRRHRADALPSQR